MYERKTKNKKILTHVYYTDVYIARRIKTDAKSERESERHKERETNKMLDFLLPTKINRN